MGDVGLAMTCDLPPKLTPIVLRMDKISCATWWQLQQFTKSGEIHFMYEIAQSQTNVASPTVVLSHGINSEGAEELSRQFLIHREPQLHIITPS